MYQTAYFDGWEYFLSVTGSFSPGEKIYATATIAVAEGWGDVQTSGWIWEGWSFVDLEDFWVGAGEAGTVSVEWTTAVEGSHTVAISIGSYGPEFEITNVALGCSAN